MQWMVEYIHGAMCFMELFFRAGLYIVLTLALALICLWLSESLGFSAFQCIIWIGKKATRATFRSYKDFLPWHTFSSAISHYLLRKFFFFFSFFFSFSLSDCLFGLFASSWVPTIHWNLQLHLNVPKYLLQIKQTQILFSFERYLRKHSEPRWREYCMLPCMHFRFYAKLQDK